MNFWDSSALVPLVVEEPSSGACRDLLIADPALVVWTLAPVEVASGLRRRQREGGLDASEVDEALRRLDALAEAWTEVEAVAQVKARAARLLATHPLRAADAMQLAAAIIVTGDAPRGSTFVTRDKRLREAAQQEGFRVPEV